MSDSSRAAGSNGSGGGAQELSDRFGELRDRPTPELDSHHLWRRIEAGLTPRPASIWRRWIFGVGDGFAPVARLAYATAAVAVLAVAVWMGATALMAPPTDAQFVLLTPDTVGSMAAPADAPESTSGPTRLDVRLGRGFNGATPPEVSAAVALGVGGADALGDVRADIDALLPFEEFGLVGAWQGLVSTGDAVDVELADGYRLIAASSEAGAAPRPSLRLNAVELIGSGLEATPADLTLELGKLYVFEVLAPGADAPDLFLLIRAEREPRER